MTVAPFSRVSVERIWVTREVDFTQKQLEYIFTKSLRLLTPNNYSLAASVSQLFQSIADSARVHWINMENPLTDLQLSEEPLKRFLGRRGVEITYLDFKGLNSSKSSYLKLCPNIQNLSFNFGHKRVGRVSRTPEVRTRFLLGLPLALLSFIFTHFNNHDLATVTSVSIYMKILSNQAQVFWINKGKPLSDYLETQAARKIFIEKNAKDLHTLNFESTWEEKDLELLKTCKNIHALHFKTCKIASKTILQLVSIPSFSTLTQLILKGTAIGSSGARILADSPASNQLTSLDLSHNRIGDEGLSAIATSPSFSKIRTLILRSNKIGSIGLRNLANFSAIFQLTVLDMTDNRLDDSCTNNIATSRLFKYLEILRIGTNLFSPDGIRTITSCTSFLYLSEFDLSIDVIRNIKSLSAFIKQQKRGFIHILNPEVVSALVQVPFFSALTSLDVTGNNIGSEGLCVLAKSPTVNALKILILKNNRIDNGGVEALCSGAFSQLTVLSLGWNVLGDKGAITLANNTTLPLLTDLDLSNNEIENEGAFSLAVSSGLENLTALNLSENKIGNLGILALAIESTFKKLRAINLLHNQDNKESLVFFSDFIPYRNRQY